MKKNKLFTIFAAVTMLASTGSALLSENTNKTVQAAKRKAKKAKKAKKTKRVKKAKKTANKRAYVRVKRGAVAYRPILTKDKTKIRKIVPIKYRARKAYLKGGKAVANWSTKYKKTTYYYVVIKKEAVIVRAKDTKRIGKKRVPTLNSVMKKQQAAAKKLFEAKVDEWNKKIKAASPTNFDAKVTTETQYLQAQQASSTSDKVKFEAAKDTLKVDTKLTVLATTEIKVTKNGVDSQEKAYVTTNDNKQMLIIPADAVTLNDANADVPSLDTYSNKLKNANELLSAAKKDLGIKE